MVGALWGCAGEAPPAVGPAPVPPAVIDAGPAPTAEAPAIDAGQPIDEAHARAILAERFRAAGLRIRYDVVVTGNGFQVTADGYDPERRLGFEYLDPSEAGTDLTLREAGWVGRDGRLLVVEPGPAEHVAGAADRFLRARVTRADAGPQP